MSAPPKSWREILPVHPAADLFPLMSEAELRALGEDIKDNTLHISIVVWISREDRDDLRRSKQPKRYSLLDGRNRLDAMELVGIPFELSWTEYGWLLNSDHMGQDVEIVSVYSGDPYEYVLSANAHRRHLTGEQKREVIAKLLTAKPEASNNAIAKQVKADDKTVAKVRRDLEERSEIPNVEARTDTKGCKQPAKKRRTAEDFQNDIRAKQAEREEEDISDQTSAETSEAPAVGGMKLDVDTVAEKSVHKQSSLLRAWAKADPAAKREFVRQYWTEITQVRNHLDTNGAAHEAPDRWIEQ